MPLAVDEPQDQAEAGLTGNGTGNGQSIRQWESGNGNPAMDESGNGQSNPAKDESGKGQSRTGSPNPAMDSREPAVGNGQSRTGKGQLGIGGWRQIRQWTVNPAMDNPAMDSRELAKGSRGLAGPVMDSRESAAGGTGNGQSRIGGWRQCGGNAQPSADQRQWKGQPRRTTENQKFPTSDRADP